MQLKDFIEKEVGRSLEYKAYVDTGPILEREIAARAGLGFQGRNTTLINFEYGSWVLLAELIIDVELTHPSVPSQEGKQDTPFLEEGLGKVLPQKGTCGTCTRCIDICPTKAILKPGVIDSNKCISYLTIEHKGIIPLEFRKLMKNRIYGCDICQEVCPWNKSRQKIAQNKDFKARQDLFAPKLLDLFPMTQEQFSARFKKSPIKRAKREGFLRNVLVAMGNWADPSLVKTLEIGLQDKSPVIRAHAVWALQQVDSQESKKMLTRHRPSEMDDEVLNEFL